MDRGDIWEAINLFRYSSTALFTPRAHAVARKLLDLYDSNEIGFHVLADRSLTGTWRQGRAGHDLRINRRYLDGLPDISKMPVLSLLLVHEATHAIDPFGPAEYDARILEEMAASVLEVYYYRELSAPGVFNEANDPPHRNRPSRVVYVAHGSLPELERESEALKNDQLIDYILSPVTDCWRDISPRWIANHLHHWGGLRNRRPQTRGLYIWRLKLCDTWDTYHTGLIVEIMESINSRADWNEMMDAAGSLDLIQSALNALPQYGGRIVALERQWNVQLH